jgi:hypothetical protein
MEQTNPRGHGLGNVHTVQQVDGMSVNSQETSNQQSYYNDALSAEVTVTTSAQTAENQSGGMRVNAIVTSAFTDDASRRSTGARRQLAGQQHQRLPERGASEHHQRQRHRPHPELQRVARQAGEEDKIWFLRGPAYFDRRGRGEYATSSSRQRRFHPQPARPKFAMGWPGDLAGQPEE